VRAIRAEAGYIVCRHRAHPHSCYTQFYTRFDYRPKAVSLPLVACPGREPTVLGVDAEVAAWQAVGHGGGAGGPRQSQYFALAEVENLRRARYNAGFAAPEEGVEPLRQAFLNQADR
jgi:hypothetical protein